MVAFYDKLHNSGFPPQQTLSQMMCEEFYGCTKDLQIDKNNAKKRKSKAKQNIVVKPKERSAASVELLNKDKMNRQTTQEPEEAEDDSDEL